MNSVKKNYIFQLVYQVLILIIPLVTAPYIARVLGPEAIGTQSYTYNISNYFVYFAMLGLAKYGNRCISESKDDRQKLNTIASELISVHLFLSLISTVAYVLFVFIFVKDSKLIYFLSTIYLLGTFFDINWLFFGLEEFKLTIIRNLVVKITSTILIFVLVKKSNDLWIYVLILALSQFLSYVFLWPYLRNRISFVRVSLFSSFRKHFVPLLILFIPVVAVSLYTSMDKIMLGSIAGELELGFYEASEKIIILIMAIITSLGTVLLPRITNLTAQGHSGEVEQLVDKTNVFNCFLTFGCMFGIAGIAASFIPFFYGNQYERSIIILQVLSISIIFSSLSDISRSLYLIPNKKDKIYVLAVCAGAIVNLVLNAVLISVLGAVGAAIATVFAELSVCSIQLMFSHKGIRFKRSFIHMAVFSLFGILMFLKIFWSDQYLNYSSASLTVVKIIEGLVIYCSLSLIYLICLQFKKQKENCK